MGDEVGPYHRRQKVWGAKNATKISKEVSEQLKCDIEVWSCEQEKITNQVTKTKDNNDGVISCDM